MAPNRVRLATAHALPSWHRCSRQDAQCHNSLSQREAREETADARCSLLDDMKLS